ncbi:MULTISPECIES: MarR family winged helix-turn-helix transcriptional regulator [unclassified Streptomyces]|uniref:MarR family winged helix-turn-helix transcriptional regulator n=1 Tax=unclassified Streptomyces TaxID=2593676 RepID=UPI0025527B8E|nr:MULTISPECIES: MarR family transcriptional regulator [unclassified Streptomyces]WRZ69542.1 MarR family transcriptional regulator [Streptomyces sp. NBC_01257]WSU63486.1 MarR family transcriptional regulator [Streptomyces sp. NBC_01104]
MHQSSSPSGLTDEQRIEAAARGLLRGIGRLAQTLFRTGEFGLTRSQAAVLDALEDRPRRVTALAAYTGMAQPRVTVVLQSLEERGLASRERCAPDRRVVEATLTPAGRTLLEEGRRRMAAALLRGLDAGVEDSERAVGDARDALTTLLNAMESETS